MIDQITDVDAPLSTCLEAIMDLLTKEKEENHVHVLGQHRNPRTRAVRRRVFMPVETCEKAHRLLDWLFRLLLLGCFDHVNWASSTIWPSSIIFTTNSKTSQKARSMFDFRGMHDFVISNGQEPCMESEGAISGTTRHEERDKIRLDANVSNLYVLLRYKNYKQTIRRNHGRGLWYRLILKSNPFKRLRKDTSVPI